MTSVDDEMQEEATEAAWRAMGKVLWSCIEQNPNRPASQLSEQELSWLAVAAITGWISCRAKQAKRTSQDAEGLISLLAPMGSAKP
jgi:hypothetical protein